MWTLPAQRGAGTGARRDECPRGTLRRRRQTQNDLERLEERTLLSYVFTGGGTNAGVATGDGSGDTLYLQPFSGLVYHSTDGVVFSPDWGGGLTIAASAGNTIDVFQGNSANAHEVRVGGVLGPASDVKAHVTLNNGGLLDSLIIDDSTDSQPATGANAYSINQSSVTGPPTLLVTIAGPALGAGVTLKGGTAANTFNVNATAVGQPVTLTGNTGADTFNVASTSSSLTLQGGAGSNNYNLSPTTQNLSSLAGPVTVTGSTGIDHVALSDQNGGGGTYTVAATTVAAPGFGGLTYATIDDLTLNSSNVGSTITVSGTSANTTLNTGNHADTVIAVATGDFDLNIHGNSGLDLVTLGGSTVAPLGMQGLQGTIAVDNSLSFSTLTLDDSQDTTGQPAVLSNNGTTGTVTGLSPAIITYRNTDLSGLTVKGGSGPNAFTVDGTLYNPGFPNTVTTIDKGTGDGNAVAVLNSTAGTVLNLTGGGTIGDLVTLTPGSHGTVNIDELPGSTTLVLDLANDGKPHNFDLSSDGTISTLHDLLGNLPSDVTYVTTALASFVINADASQNQTLNLDFSKGGNPIPIPGASPTIQPNFPSANATLFYNAGDPSVSNALHTLNILGTLPSGPFASEIHNANDPAVTPDSGQYGSIAFVDATFVPTAMNYTGLNPINDTASAASYTFNDFADDPSFTATNGPTVLGFNTVQFANTPAIPPATFETTNVANKTSIVFNTPANGVGVTGVVNITTAATGLGALTFNTPTNADNQVSFLNVPAGVVTRLNGSPEEDVTNVVGKGVPAGTGLFLNGGGGVDTLNYDAGGLNPSVVPGANPGEILIILPGFGNVDASNYKAVNITNVAPLTITPGAARTIPSVEGFQLVDAVVGTFTLPLPAIGTPPVGVAASHFTATINWGDPAPDLTAGTITQDASNPSVYQITGTHTFAAQGNYTVASSIAFAGASYNTAVNGVPINVALPAAGPTAGNAATVNVVHGPLNINVFPTVGVAGVVIPSAPIATFVDAGGADAIGNYSATINIYDGLGALVLSLTPASITQNGTAAQYTITAPAFTLNGVGTYRVLVTVTDSGGAAPITVAGASTAIISSTPPAVLTPGVQPVINTTEAASFPVPVFAPPLFRGPVASFTSSSPTTPTSLFEATIDWGDGTPPTLGTVTQPGGSGTVFVVSGAHTYADSGVDGGTGTYPVQVFIVQDNGTRLRIANTANVADNPILIGGNLNPASDSGKFNNDGITNINQPNFYGVSEPLSLVSLYANGTMIAMGHADSHGFWSLTSIPLADGTYSITAMALDQFGVTANGPVPILSALVIDTVAPRVSYAGFDRFTSTAYYTFQDYLPDGITPGGTGLLPQSLGDSANFSLNRVHTRPPGTYIATAIQVIPGVTAASNDVAVTFNNGRSQKGGYFQIVARSRSDILALGIQDLAGNALDGEFYGQQSASGNGVAGGDFVANITSIHQAASSHGYSGPVTIIGYPHPNDPPWKVPTVVRTRPVRTVPAPVKKPAAVSVPKTSATSSSSPTTLNQWYSIRERLLKNATGARGGN